VTALSSLNSFSEQADLNGHTPVDVAMNGPGYPEVVKILEPLVQNPDLQARIAKWWEKRSRVYRLNGAQRIHFPGVLFSLLSVSVLV